MFKCNDCGRLFEEPKRDREQLGEYWGMPAYEDFDCCPYCNGDFSDAVRCDDCGEYFYFDEVYNVSGDRFVCEECRDKIKYGNRYNVKACYDMLRDETEKIEINPVLTMLLSKDEIEQILLNTLIEAKPDCLAIIEEYEDWFLEENNGGDDE